MREMTDPAPKKIDEQGYWRYVFAPLFMIVIAFGIYIIFTMPDEQSMSNSGIFKQLSQLSDESPLASASAFRSIPSSPRALD